MIMYIDSPVCVIFWFVPRYLDAGEQTKRKHTTFKTRRKFEIKKVSPVLFLTSRELNISG
jgi:hypothetical protein